VRPLSAFSFAVFSGSCVSCYHGRLLAQARCHIAVLDAGLHLLGNFTLRTLSSPRDGPSGHLVIVASARHLFSLFCNMAGTKLVDRLLDLSKAGIEVLPLFSRGDTHGRVVRASSFVARKGSLP
jgi:hypothetical protein